jgi:hypothetical protein
MPVVTLKHPGLADGQTITVDEMSVYHYKRSGWKPADEKSEEPTARKKSEAK